ncbi:MAG: efflux RND transporter periplasmic adaptor subunit [Deltaproteobacteria bacterium]|nr:efflux RND transporter periplasmic adaptor subunit [Deltaproteobacteria bacterium]
MSELRGRRLLVAALAVALLAGVAYVSWKAGTMRGPAAESQSPAAARYHCPMHPTMVSNQPGDCPICGMRMVPIDEGASAEELEGPVVEPGPRVAGRAAIRLPEGRRQLIGVRTTAVARKPLRRTIKAVGQVTYDETRMHHVHTKTGGWVEHLYANATGEMVKAGEPLLTIYSPELVASAQEYLIALEAQKRLGEAALPSVRQGAAQLLASARQRLLLFDLTPQQIKALEQSQEAPTTNVLHAPISGHIIARNVTQGERIDSGTKLLDIADLSRVWVLADIYEYELPFVHLGQAASMKLSYLPGKVFAGEVTLIYPVVTEATRTVKVRIEFANGDFTLKPQMYAEVAIDSTLGEALLVPQSAVISSGRRDLVFVDRGDGYLEPRQLDIGMRLADEFEVIAGLVEGERVLTSGNFLVDSESKLTAALAEAGSAAGHSH